MNTYPAGQIDWRLGFSLFGLHVLGLGGVIYFVFHFNPWILAEAVIYYFLCHIGVTVGAHRYFTHQSYQAKQWFAIVLCVLFTATGQGPLYWWIAKHLQHHGNEDKSELDPHTPNDGFWHAHFLWLLKPGAVNVPDRYMAGFEGSGVRNEVIRWQKKYHSWLSILMIGLFPAFLGWCHGDVAGGFLLIGFTRLIVQYHTTWSVNSLGHSYGESIDGLATCYGGHTAEVVTFGESPHAYHHTSPGHYRIGRGPGQWDPGARLIYWASHPKRAWTWDLQTPPDRRRRPVVV